MKYFVALVLSGFMSFTALAQAPTQSTQKVIADLNAELLYLNAQLMACQQGTQPQATSEVEVEQTGPYTYDMVNGVWLDGYYAPVVYPWFIYGGVRYNRGFGRGYSIAHSPGFGRGHSTPRLSGRGPGSGSGHTTGHSHQGHK